MIIKRFASVDIGVALMITDALVAVSSLSPQIFSTSLSAAAGTTKEKLGLPVIFSTVSLRRASR